ncbi:glycosyltransferase [Actinomycetospora straminea]|uniref:glycosyltransferase n=1 Tax=Actinomycetospora straminea TaxID=663607 RepID=UPI0023660371|nr:glycosyltransferase [Actinomycetospora straminea]MDD7934628.1 glycosyltransferase [Actinomycetospora straminea]
MTSTVGRSGGAAGTVEMTARPAGAGNTALLQRVILPRPADPTSVRALYLDEGTATSVQSAAPTAYRPGTYDDSVEEFVLHVRRSGERVADVTSRTSVRLPERSEVSFAAYFNAFPAAYWRRWSVLDAVALRLRVRGRGRVDVYRSTARGVAVHLAGEVVDTTAEGAEAEREVVVPVSLTPFADGGWTWFDLASEHGSLELVAGGWFADRAAPGRAAVTVGMPTFNRPSDCVATLRALGDDPLVRDTLTAVIIPDQGSSKVRDQPGFEEAAAALGDRLRIIDQPNLGGSGGYARIMYEALESTDCEQILFMDDDVVLEPDSVLRALAFSRFARDEMLVGGQMLSLQARSHLHAMGEVVDRGRFFWQIAPHTEDDHDFAVHPLRETSWMHRRTDVDYNAWWMCLIPRSVAERIGLPLPLFIKWDDCEYGLRAGSHGIPTATVPGVAIWHMSFVEKDDTSDWQAYFHVRNRLVVAALHGPDNPRAMLADSLKRTLRHLFLLEYSTIALHHMAMRDFLSGPRALFGALPTALGAVRATRAEFPDGTVHRGADDLPRPAIGAREAQLWPKPPVGKVAQVAALARGLRHQLRPVDPAAHERPQRDVPAEHSQWFMLAMLDGAAVTTSDGSGVTFRKRDREMFWSMLRESVRLHAEVGKAWPALRRRYREAMGELVSREAWREQVFDRFR